MVAGTGRYAALGRAAKTDITIYTDTVHEAVGIGNVIDVQVLDHPGVLRTAIIFFYLSNEGLSLTENAAHLGLPVPEKLKEVLEQLHDRHDEEEK